MESLEQLIGSLAGSLKIILEGISVLCILVGLLTTLRLAAKQRWRYVFSGIVRGHSRPRTIPGGN